MRRPGNSRGAQQHVVARAAKHSSELGALDGVAVLGGIAGGGKCRRVEQRGARGDAGDRGAVQGATRITAHIVEREIEIWAEGEAEEADGREAKRIAIGQNLHRRQNRGRGSQE